MTAQPSPAPPSSPTSGSAAGAGSPGDDPGRPGGAGPGARHDADLAHAAALAGLPGMGPARLRALLRAWSPPEAWRRVLAGRAAADRGVAQALGPALERATVRWAAAARACDPAAVLDAHRAAGATVLLAGTPGYPPVLAGDPEPPVVLFARGDLAALAPDRPRVAVVGTRRCTAAGASVARELGHDLAAAGVAVVSGLAVGIDGAAHRGALAAGAGGAAGARAVDPAGQPGDGGVADPTGGAAPPVGVVGSGFDVVYPARHRDLWDDVAAAGVLLSEAPLGGRPEPWRFPARNRVIAGLAEVVVVVESHARGGSLHTVDEAADRGIPVLAVPGSVRSPASAGTNQLLHDGCAPARSADDVLDALPPRWPDPRPAPTLGPSGHEPGIRGHDPTRPAPSGPAGSVLDALGGAPAALEQLAARTGLDLGVLALAVEELVASGQVAQAGGWFERVAR